MNLNRRILVIDDEDGVINTFQQILSPRKDEIEVSKKFDLIPAREEPKNGLRYHFELDTASNGEEGYENVLKALSEEVPYSVAFVDMRMPGGWPGIRAIREIRRIDKHIEFVVVTAYADYSLEELVEAVENASKLVFLRKPFNKEEIQQVALNLATKWTIEREREETEKEKEKLQRQLLQAQKMEAIGQLAGGIAHDFNNMLAGIQGHAQLLMMETEQETPTYRHIQTINQSAQSAAKIIRGLLTFSRQTESQQSKTILNMVVEETVELLRHAISKRVKIEIDLSPKLNTVKVDRTQIQQVLMNLGLNAKDAMPDGGNITVKTASVIIDDDYCRGNINARAGHFVVMSVQDDGIGIDEETRERIFEPFFTTKEKQGGTGLGLAMVYGIIKNHDGWIDVHSELGVGARFEIYLPASPKF